MLGTRIFCPSSASPSASFRLVFPAWGVLHRVSHQDFKATYMDTHCIPLTPIRVQTTPRGAGLSESRLQSDYQYAIEALFANSTDTVSISKLRCSAHIRCKITITIMFTPCSPTTPSQFGIGLGPQRERDVMDRSEVFKTNTKPKITRSGQKRDQVLTTIQILHTWQRFHYPSLVSLQTFGLKVFQARLRLSPRS